MRVERINIEPKIENEDFEFEELSFKIEKFKNNKKSIIQVLQIIQNEYGYLPKSLLLKSAEFLNLSLTDFYSVASFYSQFRFEPIGKHHIKVCQGTACHVQNSKLISEELQNILSIKDNQTTSDKVFSIESVACVGCCSLAPVIMIGEQTFGKLTTDKTSKIIKEIKKNESLKKS